MNRKLESKAIRIAIGKKIRMLREMANMTQIELAAAIGMSSTGAISQIENGEKGIKLHAILRAADVLGIHPIVLLSINDMDKSDLKLMIDMMSFMKKKKKEPAVFDAHMAAIKKLIEE
jgi:transcriptional regulator with XRE-family HTH domain